MFIFGLCSTSDDEPSNLSDKMAVKLSKNEMFFLDYIQLLMIGQEIQAMKVAPNAGKKGCQIIKK